MERLIGAPLKVRVGAPALGFLAAIAAAMLVGCTTVASDQSSVPGLYTTGAVAYSPGDRQIASATHMSDSVFLFDAKRNKPLSYMTPTNGVSGFRLLRPLGLAFSHRGKWLATNSRRESLAIRIW
jgi:hypothetical protein